LNNQNLQHAFSHQYNNPTCFSSKAIFLASWPSGL
jgi:hypothetical protein